jgi:hypothetical protein
MLGIGPGVRRGDGLKAVALLHFTHPSSTSSRRKPGPMPSQQNCNAACFMPARTTFPSMLTCPAPDQAALLPIINSKDREMITLSGRSISSTKEQICLFHVSPCLLRQYFLQFTGPSMRPPSRLDPPRSMASNASTSRMIATGCQMPAADSLNLILKGT